MTAGRELKRMQSAKILKLVSIATLLAICLSACGRSAQNASEGSSISLPEPPEIEQRQILGDSSASDSLEVTLYCATDNSPELSSVTRVIHVKDGDSQLRAVLLELLNATPGGGALLVGSAEAQLTDVEFGCGVATVRLALDASVNRSDQDYLLLYSSIANTLLGMDGVEAVNLLAGDRSISVCAIPTGTFVRAEENAAAAYAQTQVESERFLAGGGASLSRSALLYFPSSDGQYLLPEAREVSFSSSDYALALIDALKSGPQARTCCFAAMPGNQELLSAAPELSVSGAGERVLDVGFTSMLPSYLAMAGVEPWQLYGSLALTLLSFIPDLSALRISIDGVYVTECAMPDGRRVQFEDGLMRREDYAFLIGSCARLYFAREGGTLAAVECAVAQSASASAGSILRAMIAVDDPGIEGLTSVFPEGILPEDILGVRVENRTAIVNLSGKFYARCQSLSAAEERALIYGMINALAELSSVGAVSFLVEGRQVDSLAQDIYLKSALMPDPGLVVDTSN